MTVLLWIVRTVGWFILASFVVQLLVSFAIDTSRPGPGIICCRP